MRKQKNCENVGKKAGVRGRARPRRGVWGQSPHKSKGTLMKWKRSGKNFPKIAQKNCENVGKKAGVRGCARPSAGVRRQSPHKSKEILMKWKRSGKNFLKIAQKIFFCKAIFIKFFADFVDFANFVNNKAQAGILQCLEQIAELVITNSFICVRAMYIF